MFIVDFGVMAGLCKWAHPENDAVEAGKEKVRSVAGSDASSVRRQAIASEAASPGREL